METAREIAYRFASSQPAMEDLGRAILRHMEFHIFEAMKVEREMCAKVAEARADDDQLAISIACEIRARSNPEQ